MLLLKIKNSSWRLSKDSQQHMDLHLRKNSEHSKRKERKHISNFCLKWETILRDNVEAVYNDTNRTVTIIDQLRHYVTRH
jgi:hypothetical protein